MSATPIDSLALEIVATNGPVDAGDLLEVTVTLENEGDSQIRPALECRVDGESTGSTRIQTIDPGETATTEFQQRTVPATEDDEISVVVESGGRTDERSVTVRGIDELDDRLAAPDSEITVRSNATVMFEIENDGSGRRSTTHWYLDGDYVAPSSGPWEAAYRGAVGRDYWQHDFEDDGTYEVIAAVVTAGDNRAYRWDVTVTPDGDAPPSLERARPAAERLATDDDHEVALELSSPDADLDRVVWWLGQADALLDVSDLRGREDTATIRLEGECHTCTVYAWVIDENNVVTEATPWTFDESGQATSDPSSDPTADPPTTTPSLTGRLERAEVVETVRIEGEEYVVLREIPDEPADRYAFVDADSNLLEPTRATDVATAFTWTDSYPFDSSERLAYTNTQHRRFEHVERLARTANVLSSLSGAIALAKIDPESAVDHAGDALEAAVEWGLNEVTNPYREQYTRMAAASSTVSWADREASDPTASLSGLSDDALEIARVMLETAETLQAGIEAGEATVEAVTTVAESASTVREVVRRSDSIRDDVDDVDGVSQLRTTAYTVAANLVTDTVVGAAVDIAEAQAKSAALGAGNAAARRPLLHEIIALEQRTRDGTLAPAGILRLQSLRQTDYQLEAAALDAMADYQAELSSGLLGAGYDALYNTDELAEQFSRTAESWRQLSYHTLAQTGREFGRALDRYEASLNYREYGEQRLFDRQ